MKYKQVSGYILAKEIDVEVSANCINNVADMLKYTSLEIGGYCIGTVEDVEDEKEGCYTLIKVEDLVPVMGFGEDEDGKDIGSGAAYTMNAEDQLKFMDKHNMNTIVGTWHTHPGGTTPSAEDIKTFFKYGGDKLFVNLIFDKSGNASATIRCNNTLHSAQPTILCNISDDLYEYVMAMEAKYKEIKSRPKIPVIGNQTSLLGTREYYDTHYYDKHTGAWVEKKQKNKHNNVEEIEKEKDYGLGVLQTRKEYEDSLSRLGYRGFGYIDEPYNQIK